MYRHHLHHHIHRCDHRGHCGFRGLHDHPPKGCPSSGVTDAHLNKFQNDASGLLDTAVTIVVRAEKRQHQGSRKLLGHELHSQLPRFEHSKVGGIPV
ncbi:hypothetical protein M0R45_025470 [Rubus argutus]|uniref:Uncharacterized protein n=1 Tax=Rubus argutus TaxID=59490 RepID=A0AAW1WUQ5_RUBAR